MLKNLSVNCWMLDLVLICYTLVHVVSKHSCIGVVFVFSLYVFCFMWCS
jgi:hypothetical protein